jgi:hypothetical protein
MVTSLAWVFAIPVAPELRVTTAEPEDMPLYR